MSVMNFPVVNKGALFWAEILGHPDEPELLF